MNLGRDSGSFKISEGKDNEGREYAIRRLAGRRKEGDRCARRSTANFWMQITVVSKGWGCLADENAGRRWYANRKLLQASSSPSA